MALLSESGMGFRGGALTGWGMSGGEGERGGGCFVPSAFVFRFSPRDIICLLKEKRISLIDKFGIDKAGITI